MAGLLMMCIYIKCLRKNYSDILKRKKRVLPEVSICNVICFSSAIVQSLMSEVSSIISGTSTSLSSTSITKEPALAIPISDSLVRFAAAFIVFMSTRTRPLKFVPSAPNDSM